MVHSIEIRNNIIFFKPKEYSGIKTEMESNFDDFEIKTENNINLECLNSYEIPNKFYLLMEKTYIMLQWLLQ